MDELINTPMFGILLSLLAFEIGLFIQKKTAILRMRYLEPNTVLLTINSAVLTKILFIQYRKVLHTF